MSFLSPHPHHVFYSLCVNSCLMMFFLIISISLNALYYGLSTFLIELLSCLVLLWRFQAPKDTSDLYLKMYILEKREIRARMAQSFLLLIQATIFIVASGNYGDIRMDGNIFLIFSAICSIIFIFIKLKFSVDLSSRALEMGCCFSLVCGLISVFFISWDANIINDTYSNYALCLVFLGCISVYVGIYVFLVATCEYNARFWDFSWWNADSEIINVSEVKLPVEGGKTRPLSAVVIPGFKSSIVTKSDPNLPNEKNPEEEDISNEMHFGMSVRNLGFLDDSDDNFSDLSDAEGKLL